MTLPPDATLPEITYVADALCSWCYAFAPVIDQVRDSFAGRVRFRLIHGGLRPGRQNASPMDAAMRDYLRQHWQAVGSRTGLPFDFTRLDRNGGLYDTEPPARLAVAVRGLAPDQEYACYHEVQRAYYADGLDVNDEPALLSCAAGLVADPDELRDRYRREETGRATWHDFSLARSLGVTSFPTLLLGVRETWKVVCSGYQPIENVESRLEALLAT